MAKQTKEAGVSGVAAKQKAMLEMLDSIANLSQSSGGAAATSGRASSNTTSSAAKSPGGGNSRQRRKNIRQQNVDMRKALEKLHRKVGSTEAAFSSTDRIVLGATAPPAATTPAAGAIAETAAGAAEQTPGKLSLATIFGKGKAAMKTSLGKGVGMVGVALLLDSLLKGGLDIAGQIGQANLQGEAMDAQIAANSGPAATEQALQPITKAQRDQALMLLMRQLGVKQSNVADGEAWT